MQEKMFTQFAARGYRPTKITMDKVFFKHRGAGQCIVKDSKAPVVVGVHKSKSPKSVGKSLVLNSHTDVVPVVPEEIGQTEP